MIPETILDGGIHYNEIPGPEGSAGFQLVRLFDWDDDQTILLTEEACIELFKKLHEYMHKHKLGGFV